MQVRSPAPPLVALVGLLGILIGEQIIPVSKQLRTAAPFLTARSQSPTIDHLFGELPGRQGAEFGLIIRNNESQSS
jgi:xanthosine utilization system XapX-like protein